MCTQWHSKSETSGNAVSQAETPIAGEPAADVPQKRRLSSPDQKPLEAASNEYPNKRRLDTSGMPRQGGITTRMEQNRVGARHSMGADEGACVKCEKTDEDAAYMGEDKAIKKEDRSPHVDSDICKKEEADVVLKVESSVDELAWSVAQAGDAPSAKVLQVSAETRQLLALVSPSSKQLDPH